MTFLVLMFWSLTSLPGLALVSEFRLVGRSAGVLAWIACAYLLSFAVLSPLSLACYALHLPLGVFVAGWALAVGLGAWKVINNLRLEKVLHALKPVSCIALVCAAVLIADMYGSTRIGGLAYDGRFHVARVRMLLDHGFNSWDPYVFPHHFSRAYHTNLYTALLATLSWLTGDKYEAWTLSLPWAKLVQAAGVYFCTLVVFRRRDVAWMSVAAFVVYRCMTIWVNYHNQLSAFWLLPLALAYLIRMRREAHTGASCWLFAITLGVLAQVHLLTAMLAALVLLPIFALGLLRRRGALAQREQQRVLLLAGLSFLLLTPFLAATKLVDRPSEEDRELAVVAAQALDPPLAPQPELPIVSVAWERRAADPQTLYDPSYAQPWLIASFLVLAFSRWRRRRSIRFLIQVGLVAGGMLYLPGLFGLLAAVAGQEWIVSRLVLFFPLLLIILGPGSLSSFLGSRYAVLGVVLTAAVLPISFQNPRIWGLYWDGLIANQRTKIVAQLKAQESFFSELITPGSVVLVHPGRARAPAIHHNVYVVAVREGSPDLPGWGKRVMDTHLLWDPATPPELRARLTRRYGLSNVVTSSRAELDLALVLYKAKVIRVYRWKRRAVLVLSPEEVLSKPDFIDWDPPREVHELSREESAR